MMVKITLGSLLLLTSLFQHPAYCLNPDGTAPVARLQPQFGIIDQSQNSALTRVFKLETSFYGRPYDKDTLAQRVSRLENNVFGNTSYDALNDRLERLERALGKEARLKIENPPVSRAKSKTQVSPVNETADRKFADLLTKAQADISLRRFHAAAEELMNAIQINPSSSLAFRQLGDVLVELKDFEGAIESYKACFENDAFGENGKYAKSKLLSLSARNAASKLPVQDAKPVVQNTVNTVNRQVQDYTNRMQFEGQRNSNRIMRESSINRRPGYSPAYGNESADEILRRARQGLLGAGFGGTVGGATGARRGTRIGFGPGEFSNLDYLRGSYTRADSRVRAMAQERESTQRAANFAESAANLKDQLVRPVKSGQPNLRALGTNVYVRYYGNDTPTSADDKVPEDPAIELRAKQNQLKN